MSAPSQITSDSVILVSGGAKGITAECVIALARQFQCKFILVGRSSLDRDLPAWALSHHTEAEAKRLILEDMRQKEVKATPSGIQAEYNAIQSHLKILDTLKAVREAGGQAVYVSADISDPTVLREKLSGVVKSFGPVTGIIHAAGSLADKLIEKKTTKDFDTVFTPKVLGLKSLLETIPPEQLSFLVLFSSIVSRYGNVGQADYAISNAILDQSARWLQHRYPNCRVLSINWGPWEAGMVTPELKKLFAQRNIELISLESGAQTLVNLLANGRQPQDLQVVIGSQPLQPTQPLTADLRSFTIHRKLKLANNPFLQDHIIGQNPVLPATAGASWIADGSEQLYPGYRFFSLEDYRVLKGIVFDGKMAEEYALDLQEVSKSEDEVVLDARIWSQNGAGKKFFHYSARVTLLGRPPAAVEYDLPRSPTTNQTEALTGQSLYQDGTLFHGPSFQGVIEVFQNTPEGLILRGSLPEVPAQVQGQFPVRASNPYINDAIVQCLLIWSQINSQAPCLPSRLNRMEQYRLLKFNEPFYVTLQVRSSTENSVVGDIDVQDEKGRLCFRLVGLEGTLSQRLKRLISTQV